eukprot:TRINITY_DN17255_c0_g1_i3.p1 TRINITY_DN17255_c0_g1~~TRINITY_DN17255_c0_g1_i3.p1  ORF type:complete len:403 (-),score=45.31 TRINITY_DN17255_c0_g1_i3:92-1219(-)
MTSDVKFRLPAQRIIGSCTLFLYLLGDVQTAATKPRTEAEIAQFNWKNLKMLNRKGVEKVVAYLKEVQETHKFLGPWHSNATLLLEINEQLIRGDRPVILHDFFDASVVEGLQQSIKQIGEDGLLSIPSISDRPEDQDTDNFDVQAYDAAKSLQEKCKVLDTRFTFRHHDWAQKKVSDKLGSYHPKLKELYALQNDDRWIDAWNYLLKGSGFFVKQNMSQRLAPPSADGKIRMPTTLREWMPGDFSLLHHDMVHGRALSINIYLSTPDWKEDWGGNFIWCGPEPFSDVTLVVPASNSASFFIPTRDSFHAVDLVRPESAAAGGRRYSLTAFHTLEFAEKPGGDNKDTTYWRHVDALRKLRHDVKAGRSKFGKVEL